MIHFHFLSRFSRIFSPSLSLYIFVSLSLFLTLPPPCYDLHGRLQRWFGFLTLATSLLSRTGMADVSSNNSDVTDFLAGRLAASLTLTEVIWINTSWLSASHVRRPSILVCFFQTMLPSPFVIAFLPSHLPLTAKKKVSAPPMSPTWSLCLLSAVNHLMDSAPHFYSRYTSISVMSPDPTWHDTPESVPGCLMDECYRMI